MKNLRVPFCTIEQIVGKLEKLQGEKRGRIGRTRMEDLEMLANVIQSQDTIGKKKSLLRETLNLSPVAVSSTESKRLKTVEKVKK